MKKRLFRNFYLTVIAPIVVFWLVIFALGYPLPNGDDLFCIGVAINLSETGELVNPWLSAWNERTSLRYFVQPPFHPYALAAWLSLVGVSTRSFLFFNCICYCLFSVFTALTLKHFKFHPLLALTLTPLYSFWILTAGLRPEVLGMAFLAVGLWFLTRDRVFQYFWGFCSLGAALLSSPIVLAYSLPFSLAIVGSNYYRTQSPRSRYLILRIIAALAAAGTIFFLLLLCVDFQLNLFLSDLSWHSSFRRQSITAALPAALWIVTLGFGEIVYGSLYALYLLALGWLWVRRKAYSSTVKGFIISLTMGLILNLFIYASTITGIFNFFCWVGIATVVSEAKLERRKKGIMLALCALVLALNNSINLIYWVGSQPGSQETYRQVREFVRANPQRTYVMDSHAVRFAFDYNLPVEIIDWGFSVPAPDARPKSLADKPANFVYIVSPIEGGATSGFPEAPRIELLGRKFSSLWKHPYDLMIIE